VVHAAQKVLVGRGAEAVAAAEGLPRPGGMLRAAGLWAPGEAVTRKRVAAAVMSTGSATVAGHRAPGLK